MQKLPSVTGNVPLCNGPVQTTKFGHKQTIKLKKKKQNLDLRRLLKNYTTKIGPVHTVNKN